MRMCKDPYIWKEHTGAYEKEQQILGEEKYSIQECLHDFKSSFYKSYDYLVCFSIA